MTNEQALRLRAVTAAPGVGRQDDADLVAVPGHRDLLPPPVHQTQTLVGTRDDQRSAVRAHQAVFVPASSPAPNVGPPVPLELTSLFRVLRQFLQQRQVIFAYKPQRQLIAHAHIMPRRHDPIAGGRFRSFLILSALTVLPRQAWLLLNTSAAPCRLPASAIAWSHWISPGTSVFSMASTYGWIWSGQRTARIFRSHVLFAATTASTSDLNLSHVVPSCASVLTVVTAALNGAALFLYSVRAWAIVRRAGEGSGVLWGVFPAVTVASC